jgi:hypothetical protein
MLLSFPGSGNTWLRLLVEYATGYFTGSVDVNDKELMSRMPGESVCDPRVALIKGHPSDLKLGTYCAGRVGGAGGTASALAGAGAGAGSGGGGGTIGRPARRTGGTCVYNTERNQAKKCRLGGIAYFSRFVYVVRDPYKAMLADFQRHITGSHIGSVSISAGNHHRPSDEEDEEDEDEDKSAKNVQGLPTKVAQRSFNASEFDGYIDQQTRSYEHKYATLITPLTRALGADRLLVVRFEDLLDPRRRLAALQSVVQFLRLPADPARLQCAFAMAERPELAHRTHKLNQTFAYAHLTPAFKATVQTRLEAHLKFVAALSARTGAL